MADKRITKQFHVRYFEDSRELEAPLFDRDLIGSRNDANGETIGFYDADSNADSIDMHTFKINIGGAANDITVDDLAAGIGGFIA